MSTLCAKLENMRADRLVATLLLLQARGRVTAAELAGELEVSVEPAPLQAELARIGSELAQRYGGS